MGSGYKKHEYFDEMKQSINDTCDLGAWFNFLFVL